MKPLVSILIPCYNADRWLAQTIESALAQTWDNTEIILVEDGSRDNTLLVAKQFESSQVKVISQENQGAASARNRALQEAQGDFIQYLDADDLIASDKIEQQMLTFSSCDEYNLITSCAWGRFNDKVENAVFISDELWQDLKPVTWINTALEKNTMMNPACWLIHRSISEVSGPWNETLSLNDDGEYFWRLILNSNGVKFCNNARVYYRSNLSGSLSSLKTVTAWHSLYESLESVYKILLSLEDTEHTRHALATAFQRFIYQAYPAVPQLRKKAANKIKILGGSNLLPQGGDVFLTLSRILGWKFAKHLQIFADNFRYPQLRI